MSEISGGLPYIYNWCLRYTCDDSSACPWETNKCNLSKTVIYKIAHSKQQPYGNIYIQFHDDKDDNEY